MSHFLAADAVTPSLVDADWLHARLGREDLLVFDSTTDIVADAQGGEAISPARAAFRAGHIPSARLLDLQADLSEPDAPYPFTLPRPASFEEGLRRLGVSAQHAVVVYSTGNPWWATRVWWLLQGYGLQNIHVLDGGRAEWKRRGFALDSGDATPARRGDITVGPARPRTVDAQALLARLGHPALRLVNALPPEKFDGRVAVHGGRPGHIPDSINLPAASLLEPQTGRLLPADLLRRRFQAAGLLDPAADVVAYCGGGVSATLVLFALAQVGRSDARLYDASLYEWAHRPDLPMQVGAGAAPA